MDGLAQGALRDANGRFIPGHSGNPAGKKAGTRNRATVLREALADGEDTAAARIVIDKALSGDAVAARFIVDRLMPRPRGREIALDLPDGGTAADVLACSNATIAAMAAGEITPDEALTVTRVLDGRLRALKAAAREERILADSRRDEKKPSPGGRGNKCLPLSSPAFGLHFAVAAPRGGPGVQELSDDGNAPQSICRGRRAGPRAGASPAPAIKWRARSTGRPTAQRRSAARRARRSRAAA